MSKCRVEQDELDYDTQQGRWAKPKSLFDFEDDIDWRVDTDHATTVKPDAFELELAKQEEERKDITLSQMIDHIMKRGY